MQFSVQLRASKVIYRLIFCVWFLDEVFIFVVGAWGVGFGLDGLGLQGHGMRQEKGETYSRCRWVHVFPAGSTLGLGSAPGDAMVDTSASQLLDVQVDHFAWLVMPISHHRWSGLLGMIPC